ncbi:Transcription factor bHLH91 [Hordeum vulgare]|nr:Transcription factor bHLH91 [Hordeum vulgare]
MHEHDEAATTRAKTSTPYLPDELASEILARLPVEPLLRFRSVCKAWRGVIDESSFPREHLRFQTSSLLVAPWLGEKDNDSPLPSSTEELTAAGLYQWDGKQQGVATLLHAMPGCRSKKEELHSMAHCDGLALLPSDDAVRVANPATRRSVTLPPTPNCFDGPQAFGLGHDPRSNAYKVACFYGYHDLDIWIEGARHCFVKMIVGGDYFEGSHDHNLMTGSLTHDSSLAPKCNDSINIELQRFKVHSFSAEVLSDSTNLSSEAARAINHLQHQLGIDLEQDMPSVETAPWDTSICTIQDQIINHQLSEDPQNILVQQQIQQYDAALYPNSAYTPAPDLLNLLHCTVAPVFPATTSVFGDTALSGTNYLDLNGEFTGVAAITDSGLMYTSDPALQLGYHATQSHGLKDICHSLPQNYGLFPSEDERDVMLGVGSVGGDLFQDMDDRQFDTVLEGRRGKGEFGKGKGKANFATERERREQLNVKYKTLRMLFPNPTKNDRASIVGDAIEYIDELNRTVKELKILVEQKWHGTNRRKIRKLDEEAAADGESSSMRPMRDEQDNQLDGAIRSSWVQRRSKECHVDVRIVQNEINIKLTEKKKANSSLLHVAKVLDEFHLEIIHVVGGIIGDHYIFMFNTKVPEGSSVYACAVAKRILQAVDAQHQALDIFN